MSQVASRGRNGPLQKLDMRRLPPGHAIFSGGNGAQGLIIFGGHPYDMAGQLLQADTAWLRANGYRCDADVIRLLSMQQASSPQDAPQKQCTQCGVAMPMQNKFCAECGTPQVKLWAPGDGDEEGDRLAKLIDPEDPLSSLVTLTHPRPDPKRETPEEIYQRLTKDEAAKTLREVGKDLPQDADPGLTKLENNAFGTVVVQPKTRARK